ncbi:MAG: hypothetical protein RLZZ414_1730, partial [Bacteroidota bacterium]
ILNKENQLNSSLLSSFKNFSQDNYQKKCDLILKYNVLNVFSLPCVSSVTLIGHNLAFDNRLNTEETGIFQFLLLYYLLVLFLPNFYFDNKNLYTAHVSDQSKIDYLLKFFILESNSIVKKNISLRRLDSTSKIIFLSVKIEFLTRNFILNKELLLLFGNVSISSVEKMVVKINFMCPQKFISNISDLNLNKLIKNQLWYFDL